MRLVILAVVAMLACVQAAPVLDDIKELMEMMSILLDKRERTDTSYSFEFETADGQSRKEIGKILNKGTKEETLVVMGRYSYPDAFGEQQTRFYKSDKKGHKVYRMKDLDKKRMDDDGNPFSAESIYSFKI